MVYYLLAYLVTNLAAFGIVSAYGKVTGSDEMTSYYGMSRRAPGLALAFMVALLISGGYAAAGRFRLQKSLSLCLRSKIRAGSGWLLLAC